MQDQRSHIIDAAGAGAIKWAGNDDSNHICLV